MIQGQHNPDTPDLDALPQRAEETWPEWTAITTAYDDPGGEDPDEYEAQCFRCHTDTTGTRSACILWAQGHADDPEPAAPALPPAPKKGGHR